MKTLFTTLLFLVLSQITFAQNHTPTSAGAKGMATGQTRVTANDVNSVFGNQAGLAFLEKTAVTVFGENRFALADINQFSVGAGLPSRYGTFGLAVQYYGFESYNEQKIGLSYARKLAKNFAIGAQFDYLNLRIPEYGNQANFTFELGLQAIINEKVRLGGHIFSPITRNWNENNTVPSVFALGVTYQPTDKISLVAEAEKSSFAPVNIKAGIDYQIIEALSFRVGVTTFPVQNTFGIGWHIGHLQIDVSTAFHYLLGVSTGLSVGYEF
jgi:long-subunit fatty acid transport protein